MAQPIDAPLAVVERAYLDPSFYEALGDLPNIAVPEVLDQHAAAGGIVRMSVRYRFTGHLAPPARAVLDPHKLSWVNDVTVDVGAHRTDFRMIPDHYAHRLTCTGSYWFSERPNGTLQEIEGDLRVRYPIVGPVVERAILLGMRQHLEEQARVLERWAAQRS